MDSGTVWRAWLGAGTRTIATVAVWRLASIAAALGLVEPIMNVGRRPYRIGHLIDRLNAIKDMTLVADSLPVQLSWFAAVIAVTAVGGLVTPVRLRRIHGAVAAGALVVAIAVYRAAGRSDLISATTQLRVVIALLSLAVVAAALPASRQPGRR